MLILLDGLTEVISSVGQVFDFVNNYQFQLFQKPQRENQRFP
jgi:hypothetical protein